MDEKIIIEASNLGKTYAQAHEQIIVLDNVNFNVSKGEFVSIIGPSGSGKSTLLNIIGLMDSIFSGEIKVFSKSVSNMSEEEKSELRLKKIGFVFQFDSLLPEFSVLENIEMPSIILGKESYKKSMELLEGFSLEKIAHKMPSEISGGEKQRAAILRALRNSPELLIADEPTGNLDPNNAVKVMNDLSFANKKGTSLIMVTHNEEMALKYSTSVYKIENQKVSKIK